jgi:3'-phosphoadenosine 5'-phosphosulfate sulfotransferase (PAPS reductase)/FAD synthetase
MPDSTQLKKELRILSFGGGVQTTALAILVAQGKVKADAVVFADTGAERPGTYDYMNSYTKPLLKESGVEFVTVRKVSIPSRPVK